MLLLSMNSPKHFVRIFEFLHIIQYYFTRNHLLLFPHQMAAPHPHQGNPAGIYLTRTPDVVTSTAKKPGKKRTSRSLAVKIWDGRTKRAPSARTRYQVNPSRSYNNRSRSSKYKSYIWTKQLIRSDNSVDSTRTSQDKRPHTNCTGA